MRIGIIGASFARSAYLPAFRLISGVDVVAIASARLSSARAAAETCNVPHAYDDWRRMLAEHSLDLVCIATPTVTHAPMAIAALEAGAHVLCEKPMAINAEEAGAMLACAEALGRVHMVGHQLRFNAKRSRIKELIDSGALGVIRHVVIRTIGSSWADAASRAAGDWWSSQEQGGGRLGANGSHQVDLLRWWFGEITAVCGCVRTMVPARRDMVTGEAWKATADDFVHFLAELGNGCLASVLLSTVARHGVASGTEIFGSQGTLTLSNDTEQLMFGRAGEPLAEVEVHEALASLPGVGAGIWNQAVVGELRELAAAIAEQRFLRQGATFLDGYRNQQVLDAVRRSERERRWVDVAT